MTPVDQRIVDPQRGDCLSACIASLFDLTLDDVPAFAALCFDAGHPETYHDDVRAWLDDHGWAEVTVRYDDLHDWSTLPGIFCIVTMPSQRYQNGWHAVVGQWKQVPDSGATVLEIVHDPNPLNKPYGTDVKPWGVHFLVPKNPAAFWGELKDAA